MSESDDAHLDPTPPRLSYETPPRDGEVPAYVPEVDGRIDAGRSIRGVGRLFPSYVAAAVYVHGFYARRLLISGGMTCVVCGRHTGGRIAALWRFSVPWPRLRDWASIVAVQSHLEALHPCCEPCQSRLTASAAVASRWTHRAILVGGLAFVCWHLLANHKAARGGGGIDYAIPPLLIVAFVAGSWLASNAWARRQLPIRLVDSVPRGLRFVRWDGRTTPPFDIERALNAARATSDRIEIHAEPLDPAAAIAAVADPSAGGVDVFLGTTRGEVRASDRVELVALDYEAYEEMAVAQLRELVTAARARWPIVRCVILHRTGRVGLAEASVLIAVACPHRVAAFEACRFLIDELKKSVAIWKKEVWADGSVSWIHPDTGVVTADPEPPTV